ncbi:MAG: hypothetical protein GQ565_09210 [Candidatus Aegiribacteria sp.]|nr:hypothetical protein [Candidatus Aegiribacteria sp.]
MNRKQTQWSAFLRKSEPIVIPGNLDATLGELVEFLMPVVNAIQKGSDFRSISIFQFSDSLPFIPVVCSVLLSGVPV